MKIIRAFPPNWIELTRYFPIKGKPGILYAWGDKIYNPSGVKVEPWILAHEQEHGLRQTGQKGTDWMTPEQWWDEYIQYEDFRLKEELYAHREEYKAFKATHHVSDALKYLDLVAARLSSPLYGSMIGIVAARDAIANDVIIKE